MFANAQFDAFLQNRHLLNAVLHISDGCVWLGGEVQSSIQLQNW